jgi:hypothetical protein
MGVCGSGLRFLKDAKIDELFPANKAQYRRAPSIRQLEHFKLWISSSLFDGNHSSLQHVPGDTILDDERPTFHLEKPRKD